MGGKSPHASHTSLERLVLPGDTNTFNSLYGGRLMEWIDNAASIVAYKHSRSRVVTGSIDSLFFLSPIKLGDIVSLDANINYVTPSTMEIEVDVFSQESLTGIKKFTTKAFLTYVAVDENGKPSSVPDLKLTTKEEKRRFTDGMERSKLRLKRLAEIRVEVKNFEPR
jgi:acyl-CoA hydrolase